MSQNQKQVTVSLELATALTEYLRNRPHREVEGLINSLRAEVTPQLQTEKPQLVKSEVASETQEKTA